MDPVIETGGIAQYQVGGRGTQARRRRRSRTGTRRRRGVAALSAAALISWLAVPAVSSAESDRAGVVRHDQDSCDQVDAAPRAEGLDKRCRGGNSSGVAKGDFNGDGFADLAIGVPRKNTPASVGDSGAVYVIYGSAAGLVPGGVDAIPPTQFWSQNTAGVPGTSTSGDRFGTAVAAGEFNGDGFSDLAIGIPGEEIGGNENTGRVVVIHGSSNGLTATSTSVPAPKSFDLTDVLAEDQFFEGTELGSALTWGDFDGDGVGDLAIGAPGYSLIDDTPTTRFVDEAGAVWVLFGASGSGVGLAGQQFFHQESQGVVNHSSIDQHTGDHFGQVLTAGDFNEDGRTDLAVASPDEDISEQDLGFSDPQGFVVDAGSVRVLFGGQNGLSGAGSLLITQRRFQQQLDALGAGRPSSDDEFGSSLAAGDIDGDGSADLVIGAPRRDFGAASSAGLVFTLDNRAASLLGNTKVVSQSSFFTGGIEEGDRFGHAVAVGDFNTDGFTDLAIGAPYEDIAGIEGQSIRNVGEVTVGYGTSSGLSFTGAQRFRQGTSGVEGTAEVDDLFGASLTAWNFGRNEQVVSIPPRVLRTADLAIGVPLEDLHNPDGTLLQDAGAVHVLYSAAASGVTTSGDQLFFQSNIGGGFTDVTGDRFGLALY